MVLVDSAKVRDIMLEKRMGVMQVAKAAKLQSTTVSHISRFDKNITLKTAGKLADGLGVEPKNFIKQFL